MSQLNMTVLKPLITTACYCARYFTRDEGKAERVAQAVMDAESLLHALKIADPTVPASPAPAPAPAPTGNPVPGSK